jgi:uncharacterized metal-binding protein
LLDFLIFEPKQQQQPHTHTQSTLFAGLVGSMLNILTKDLQSKKKKESKKKKKTKEERRCIGKERERERGQTHK